MELSLIDILTLVFGTGIVTTFISWIKDWFVSSRSLTRLSGYAALRLAIILEEFAIKCSSLIGDFEMYVSSGGHGGSATLTMPQLAEFPKDIDWKSLSSSHTAKILGLPNEILKTKAIIDEYWHIAPDAMSEVTAEYAGYCGFLALEMAKDLRSRHDLPPYEISPALWDETKDLKKHFDAIMQRKLEASQKKPDEKITKT